MYCGLTQNETVRERLKMLAIRIWEKGCWSEKFKGFNLALYWFQKTKSNLDEVKRSPLDKDFDAILFTKNYWPEKSKLL
jgi:hypothetical protein